MSVINVATIYADRLESANMSVGNTTTFTVVANQVTISTGNVTVNSSVLKLDDTQSPIYNTTINSTSISTSAIELNGVELTSIAPPTPLIDYQVFTATNAPTYWYKPSWATANDVVTIMMWGGGGGGARNGAPASAGGGGGACVIINKLAGECNSVCNVVVGAGGVNAVSANATNGGNSVFWANSTFSITAYGGAGAFANATIVTGGGGGGYFGVGNTGDAGVGGAPLGGNNSTGRDSTFGGGGPGNTSTTAGGVSVYGGGGGASGAAQGGNTIYGGAGGAGGLGPGGVSVFGGSGANNSVDATAPGGGGGGRIGTGQPKNGARGEVRVWTTASSIGGSTEPFYSIAPDTSLVYEGSSVTFTITTFNVANDTLLYYSLNNSSTAVRNDFTGAVNGSITINGGSNTFTLTANQDLTIDSARPFYMDLRTDSTSGTIVANTSQVTIRDAIPATETYESPTTITWSKNTSTTYTTMTVEMWGAGGGGGRGESASAAGGGGGGGYQKFTVAYANIPSSSTLTVGQGGAGSNTNNSLGGPGSNSVFLGAICRGGGAGGGSGGDGSAGAGGTTSVPSVTHTLIASETGGAGGIGSGTGNGSDGADVTYAGGGGGGSGEAGGTLGGAGGDSTFGGAGGRGGNGNGAVPQSTGGIAPGGGGGGQDVSVASGAGANGKIIITYS